MGTVPSPYSPVAGDDATQARVLTWADAATFLLGNATSGGSKRALSVMRQTVAQSLTSGAETVVTFDTEDSDYDNGHSTVTNTSRYTAQTAGWHQVNYAAAVAVNATGKRYAFLRLNATTNIPGTMVTSPAVAGSSTCVAGSCLVLLNVGDFVEMFVFQDSGVAVNTAVGAKDAARMSVEWRSN